MAFWYLLSCIFVQCLASLVSGQPCPNEYAGRVADYQGDLQPGDFHWRLDGRYDTTFTEGGTISAVTSNNQKALSGQGIAAALFRIRFCGSVLPHHHPRAVELVYVIQGVGNFTYVDTKLRVVTQSVSAGEQFLVPRGLMHAAININPDTDLVYIGMFNSENPGVQPSANSLFAFPENVLKTNFGGTNNVGPPGFIQPTPGFTPGCTGYGG